VDAVAQDGRHLGGLIVPGPALMRGALLRETGGIGTAANLLENPGAGPDFWGEFWGRDTATCIQQGSMRASACLVESCVNALTRPDEPAGMLFVTGGDAPGLLAALSITAEHRPLLVLEGLALRHGDPPV
jgi:type III pantothenate kinase